MGLCVLGREIEGAANEKSYLNIKVFIFTNLSNVIILDELLLVPSYCPFPGARNWSGKKGIWVDAVWKSSISITI